MSTASAAIDAACATIQKGYPKGAPASIANLAKSYGTLSKAFLDAKHRTHDLAVKVVGATDGPASNAFEGFAHQHSIAMNHFSDAALKVENFVMEYGHEVQKAYDTELDLFNQAVDLKGLLPLAVKGGALEAWIIDRAQALVTSAKDSDDKLVERAEYLGKFIANSVEAEDVRLPERATSKNGDWAFKGTYTVQIDRGVVWNAATQFLHSSETLANQVRIFGNETHGDIGYLGDDRAGHQFAAGYQAAPAHLQKAATRAADLVAYIGHGLHAMVKRHNDAEDKATAAFGQIEGHLELDPHVTPNGIAPYPPLSSHIPPITPGIPVSPLSPSRTGGAPANP